jgi:hypothetical protein
VIDATEGEGFTNAPNIGQGFALAYDANSDRLLAGVASNNYSARCS